MGGSYKKPRGRRTPKGGFQGELSFYNAVEGKRYAVNLIQCALPGGTSGYRLEAVGVYDVSKDGSEERAELERPADLGTLFVSKEGAVVVNW